MQLSRQQSELSLAKIYFSRTNTIVERNETTLSWKPNSWRSNHSSAKSKSVDEDVSEDEEDEMLSDSDDEVDMTRKREKTVLNGSLCQQRYMQACKLFQIPASDFVFTGLDRAVFNYAHRFPREFEVFVIAIGLALNKTLVEMHFIENKLTLKSLLYLCAAIWENDNIYLLELTGNPFCDTILTAISDMLSEIKIRTLIISNNEIRDAQGHIIATMIENALCLTSLNLSYNSLGDTAMIQISKALKHNDTLKELDLSWNCIRKNGAAILCKALLKNKHLRMLNLGMNGIGVEGAAYFAELLSGHNKVLVDVDISANRIFDKGLVLLCKLFSKNTTLERFSVGKNPATTSALKLLLEAIESNEKSAVLLLELNGIYIDRATQTMIDKLKLIRPRLEVIVHGVLKKGTENKAKEMDGVLKMTPLEAVRFYIEQTGSRLVDVFKFLDRQNLNVLSKSDFVKGLKEMQLPFTDAQLDELILELDPQRTGLITFGQLMAGDKIARMKMRKRREREKKAAREKERAAAAVKRRDSVESKSLPEIEEDEIEEEDIFE